MKTISALIFFMLTLTFMSCSNKQVEIYKLDIFTIDTLINGEYLLKEVYVIRNHPKNRNELICFLKKFNDSTVVFDKGVYSKATWRRTFYRETKTLNKNFKEIGRKDLSYYYKDRIAICRYSYHNRLTGFFTIFLNSLIGESVDIEDLPPCEDIQFNF